MSALSSRMSVAVHVLAYLAARRGEAVTSGRIACSVNTHPVVVRRIVGALRRAGIVSVQPGVGGGARLAREPGGITLRDVFRAVEEGETLFTVHARPSAGCDVGARITGVVHGVFHRAREAMLASLAAVTIEDVHRDLRGGGVPPAAEGAPR
jgi:Rrf2 family protein